MVTFNGENYRQLCSPIIELGRIDSVRFTLSTEPCTKRNKYVPTPSAVIFLSVFYNGSTFGYSRTIRRISLNEIKVDCFFLWISLENPSFRYLANASNIRCSFRCTTLWQSSFRSYLSITVRSNIGQKCRCLECSRFSCFTITSIEYHTIHSIRFEYKMFVTTNTNIEWSTNESEVWRTEDLKFLCFSENFNF